MTESTDAPNDNPKSGDAGQQEPPPNICLDQFLKICGVATGGQAKQLIQGGQVLVNGAIETRRRKKLFAGDVVDLDGEEFVVELAEDIDDLA